MDTKLLIVDDDTEEYYGFYGESGESITEQDIEENKIWENDILEYDGDGCARCVGVVKYGNYIQDGSGGEYRGKECIGFYVEMIKIIPYKWEEESVEEILEYFPHYYKKYSLAEILKQEDVKKVGNVFDNLELLETL